MEYEIHLGIPDVLNFWNSLSQKKKNGTITKDEEEIRKKFGNALSHLSFDPFYPGLESHEISQLTNRYGMKVFQSYLENHKPRAMRIYWVYGPGRAQITIIGIEPHPEDKKNGAYDKIKLSSI